MLYSYLHSQGGGRLHMTLTERRILANQYRILAALTKDTDERGHYQEQIEILQDGYEMFFDDQNFSSEVMTAEACKEVLKILSMYEDLLLSFRKLSDKTGIDAEHVAFPGFDGNNETKGMGFAQFFCEKYDGGGRFKSLKKAKGFAYNSHRSSFPLYRAMLREHEAIREAKKSIGGHEPLTNDEIKQILAAR